MKRCSVSLVIRQTEVKTTMRYYLIPTRITIPKRMENKCWQGCGEIATLVCCWRECKMVRFCGNVWQFLKKLDVGLPCDPTMPLLGSIYPREQKTYVHTRICT